MDFFHSYIRSARLLTTDIPEEEDEIFNIMKNQSRDDLYKAVMDPSVNLGLLDSDGYSLGGRLLEDVTNGDKIVLDKLDSYLSTTQDDLDKEDFAVVIDHKGLVNSDPNGFVFLKDLLQSPREITLRILSHPVITTFIKKKWPKWRFLFTYVVFLFFVIIYSFYLLFLFAIKSEYSEDNEETDSHYHDKINDFFGYGGDCSHLGANASIYCNRANQAPVPFKSCSSNDPWMCSTEIIYLLSVIYLILQELVQFAAFPLDYIREHENWFQNFIISMSIISFFLTQHNNRSLIASIAVGLAWIELIFLNGHLPSQKGNFSIMYYESSKRVLKSAISLLLMVVAFGLSFYILNFDNDTLDDSPFAYINRSIVLSFAWIMDKYELDELWESGESSSGIELVTMVLMLGMLVFGNLCLINLIIATIIMDLEALRIEARATSIRNQVQGVTNRICFKEFFDVCRLSTSSRWGLWRNLSKKFLVSTQSMMMRMTPTTT